MVHPFRKPAPTEPRSPREDRKREIEQFFDDLAGDIDAWQAKSRLYHHEHTAMLQRLIPKGARVLELGCGTGDALAALEPSVGVGVDISSAMLVKARQRHPHLRFVAQDVEALDLGGETFDYIVVADLVGELRDLWAAFRALRTVCNERTRVVITYYNFLWEPAVRLATLLGIKRPQMLQNWFSPRDIIGLLELNGFEPVTVEDRLLCPVDIPIVAELANRYLAPAPVVHHANLIQVVVARPSPAFHAAVEPLSVTVVVPARNERGNIRDAIRRTPKMGTHTEIIFVEGGSQDGTREEILAAIKDEPSECELRFIPQTGKGKGDAVRTAFQAARGDVLMILDADLTVAPEDLPRFHLALAEGRGDFVNGCRLVYPMEDQAMRLLNLIANKFFGVAFSYVLGQPLKDTLCGTKVLKKRDYQRIADNREVFGEFDPFGDFDLLFGAARLGQKIVEMPVRYHARTYGETQISRFRHGLLLFRMLGVATKYFKVQP